LFYEKQRRSASHSYGGSHRGNPTPYSRRQEGGAQMLRANHQPNDKEQFPTLDPSIVNAAIPTFYIGHNKAGFWVAREVKGRVGGIFLFKSSALSFAKRRGGDARRYS
jgi:hypothetical protein